MLQENEIARRLHEYMSERMTGMKVREVRIGVGYAAVALDKNLTGLAAVIRENLESHCGVVAKAGKLSGMPASELLNVSGQRAQCCGKGSGACYGQCRP